MCKNHNADIEFYNVNEKTPQRRSRCLVLLKDGRVLKATADFRCLAGFRLEKPIKNARTNPVVGWYYLSDLATLNNISSQNVPERAVSSTIKTVTLYQTQDGKTFKNQHSAERHEEKQKMMLMVKGLLVLKGMDDTNAAKAAKILVKNRYLLCEVLCKK